MSTAELHYNQLPAQRTHQIIAEHISPDFHTGLGRYVVLPRLGQTFAEINNDYTQSDEYSALTAEELARSRQELCDVPSDQRTAINQQLGRQGASDFLRAAIGLDRHTTLEAGADYIGALTEKTADGAYSVPDETFLNFLEWHSHSLATRQQAMDKESAILKPGYVQAMRQAVADGWLPPVALQRVDRVMATPVIADDGFLTIVHGTGGHAQYRSGTYTIRIAPDASGDELKHRQWHEFTHVSEGKSGSGAGMRQLFGPGYGGEVMNEAVVEQIAHSLMHGNVDATNPADRTRQGAVYRPNRALQHTLLTAGVRPIDIRLAIATYYEDDDGPAQQAYASALREVFPFTDVIGDIRKLQQTDDGLAPAIYAAKLMADALRYGQRSFDHA